jgi:hypothetical protein
VNPLLPNTRPLHRLGSRTRAFGVSGGVGGGRTLWRPHTAPPHAGDATALRRALACVPHRPTTNLALRRRHGSASRGTPPSVAQSSGAGCLSTKNSVRGGPQREREREQAQIADVPNRVPSHPLGGHTHGPCAERSLVRWLCTLLAVLHYSVRYRNAADGVGNGGDNHSGGLQVRCRGPQRSGPGPNFRQPPANPAGSPGVPKFPSQGNGVPGFSPGSGLIMPSSRDIEQQTPSVRARAYAPLPSAPLSSLVCGG